MTKFYDKNYRKRLIQGWLRMESTCSHFYDISLLKKAINEEQEEKIWQTLQLWYQSIKDFSEQDTAMKANFMRIKMCYKKSLENIMTIIKLIKKNEYHKGWDIKYFNDDDLKKICNILILIPYADTNVLVLSGIYILILLYEGDINNQMKFTQYIYTDVVQKEGNIAPKILHNGTKWKYDAIREKRRRQRYDKVTRTDLPRFERDFYMKIRKMDKDILLEFCGMHRFCVFLQNDEKNLKFSYCYPADPSFVFYQPDIKQCSVIIFQSILWAKMSEETRMKYMNFMIKLKYFTNILFEAEKINDSHNRKLKDNNIELFFNATNTVSEFFKAFIARPDVNEELKNQYQPILNDLTSELNKALHDPKLSSIRQSYASKKSILKHDEYWENIEKALNEEEYPEKVLSSCCADSDLFFNIYCKLYVMQYFQWIHVRFKYWQHLSNLNVNKTFNLRNEFTSTSYILRFKNFYSQYKLELSSIFGTDKKKIEKYWNITWKIFVFLYPTQFDFIIPDEPEERRKIPKKLNEEWILAHTKEKRKVYYNECEVFSEIISIDKVVAMMFLIMNLDDLKIDIKDFGLFCKKSNSTTLKFGKMVDNIRHYYSPALCKNLRWLLFDTMKVLYYPKEAIDIYTKQLNFLQKKIEYMCFMSSNVENFEEFLDDI